VEGICSEQFEQGVHLKGSDQMKRKHGPAGPLIKVITDPRKLAWLQARIEKQKAAGQTGGMRKKAQPKNRE
jgi:hypothetical protein